MWLFHLHSAVKIQPVRNPLKKWMPPLGRPAQKATRRIRLGKETPPDGGSREAESAFGSVQTSQVGKDAGSDPLRQRLPIRGDEKVRGFLFV